MGCGPDLARMAPSKRERERERERGGGGGGKGEALLALGIEPQIKGR